MWFYAMGAGLGERGGERVWLRSVPNADVALPAPGAPPAQTSRGGATLANHVALVRVTWC